MVVQSGKPIARGRESGCSHLPTLLQLSDGHSGVSFTLPVASWHLNSMTDQQSIFNQSILTIHRPPFIGDDHVVFEIS
jgi:hypothetical protein